MRNSPGPSGVVALGGFVVVVLLCSCRVSQVPQAAQQAHGSPSASQPSQVPAGQSQAPRLGTVASSEKGGALKPLFTVTEAPPTQQSSVAVDCRAEIDSIELLVTDPRGRRTGDDPIAGKAYDEIPEAYYESAGIDDDESGASESNPARVLYVPNPIPGLYSLAVIGTAASTFDCKFLGYDVGSRTSETRVNKIGIREGEVQKFTFEFDGQPGSQVRLSGARPMSGK